MPTPRKYANAAARQAAYRQRLTAQALKGTVWEGEGTSPPRVAPLPGPRRWRALSQQAQHLLEHLEAEMQEYYEQRSESWQESERGERHLEQQQLLQELQSALTELWD